MSATTVTKDLKVRKPRTCRQLLRAVADKANTRWAFDKSGIVGMRSLKKKLRNMDIDLVVDLKELTAMLNPPECRQ